MRQPLAAEIDRARKRVPAGLGPGPVGLLPARRRRDGAVLEGRADAGRRRG